MTGESAPAKAERQQPSAAHGAHGAEGEAATADAVAALPESWTVVRDPAWPATEFANVDHVAIGPSGVFVIDTKSWAGAVTVDDGVLLQDGDDRTASVSEASAAAAAVAGLTSLVRADHVHAVLCLVDSDLPPTVVDGVLICPTDQIVEVLTSLDTVLPGGVSRVVATELVRRLQPADRPPSLASRIGPSGLVMVVIGLLLAVVLATQPQMVTSVADRVSDVFVDQLDSDDAEPTEPEDPTQQTQKTPRKQKKLQHVEQKAPQRR